MPPTNSQNQNKLDARQCLLEADKHIKDSEFAEAKKQIEKARVLDPTNVYVTAFIDRINYFEQQKKAEIIKKEKESQSALEIPPQPQAAPNKPVVGQTVLPKQEKTETPKSSVPVNPILEKKPVSQPVPVSSQKPSVPPQKSSIGTTTIPAQVASQPVTPLQNESGQVTPVSNIKQIEQPKPFVKPIVSSQNTPSSVTSPGKIMPTAPVGQGQVQKPTVPVQKPQAPATQTAIPKPVTPGTPTQKPTEAVQPNKTSDPSGIIKKTVAPPQTAAKGIAPSSVNPVPGPTVQKNIPSSQKVIVQSNVPTEKKPVQVTPPINSNKPPNTDPVKPEQKTKDPAVTINKPPAPLQNPITPGAAKNPTSVSPPNMQKQPPIIVTSEIGKKPLTPSTPVAPPKVPSGHPSGLDKTKLDSKPIPEPQTNIEKKQTTTLPTPPHGKPVGSNPVVNQSFSSEKPPTVPDKPKTESNQEVRSQTIPEGEKSAKQNDVASAVSIPSTSSGEPISGGKNIVEKEVDLTENKVGHFTQPVQKSNQSTLSEKVVDKDVTSSVIKSEKETPSAKTPIEDSSKLKSTEEKSVSPSKKEEATVSKKEILISTDIASNDKIPVENIDVDKKTGSTPKFDSITKSHEEVSVSIEPVKMPTESSVGSKSGKEAVPPLPEIIKEVTSKLPEEITDKNPDRTKETPSPNDLKDEEEAIASPNIRDNTMEKSITASQLHDMKKQIELLSKALEQEKIAREEMNRNQTQQSMTQFRQAMEKAWQDSAPTETKKAEIRQLAITLGIPEAVVNTIQREVKIEMYGKAVKEVISKRQLLRSSSSTLEWLRKVYQISLEEYLEYESKFLLDLVADQYKGTIIQISSDESTKSELTPKLKALGYAVVTAPTPEDALEKIEKLNPNVIICETTFGPGNISGIRFLHILRSNSKFNFIPFIFLSSEEDYTLMTTSELRANEGYLKKPINFDDLSSLITMKLLWFREYIMSLSK